MKYLDSKEITYEFFDFVQNQISKDTLETLIKKSEKTIDAFFNKNGKLFKELELKEKLPSLSYDEKINYLLSDGKMIKRPIIVINDNVFIGFNEKELDEYLN